MIKILEKEKEYLFSLKYYLLISFLIFSFGLLNGFYAAQAEPEEAKLFLTQLKEFFQPVFEMSAFGQFLFVVFNNGLTLFLILPLAIIFGIFPFLVLISNGTILGILLYFSKESFSFSAFLFATLPHGLIEIPVLILAGAVGLKIGKTTFAKIFKKGGELKKEISLAFNFFLKILLPLLILAAFIEIFITAKLLAR